MRELRRRPARRWADWLRVTLSRLVLPGFLAWSASAANVNLLWNRSTDARAAGYAVYYGPVGSTSPTRSDVGNTTNAPVNNLQAGQAYFFYVTAYDSAHNEGDPSSVINYTVPAPTNTPPVLDKVADQSVLAGSPLAFTVTALDTDLPPQTLIFSLDAGAPNGASINPSTGVFTWTPSPSQVGVFTVVVRVTDNGVPALSDTEMVTITVTAPPNTAPALGALTNQVVTTTSNLTFTASATDTGVPAQKLTYSLDAGAPSGASINPTNGVFSWRPTLAQIGTFPVTVRVTDNGTPPLSSARSITITVKPLPPGPGNAPHLALRPGAQKAFTLSFTNLAGYQYLVQTNANVGTTNWGTISTVQPASSNGVVNLPQTSTNAPRLFYRVLMLLN